MTPSYFYEEMDTFDLDKAIAVMKPEEIAMCFPQKRKSTGLDEAVRKGAITRI